jgi:zinc/manganese transport system substrate-binding protein
MRRLAISAFVLAAALGAAILDSGAADGKLQIVAAENMYGDVARQIGGDNVDVVSVIENPDQDPHLFEASPSVLRALAAARIVVFNGIDYDHWMEELLEAQPATNRKTIVIADLVGAKDGDNPHLWYHPVAIPALAEALATELSAADPANSAAYAERKDAFLAAWKPVQERIADIKTKAAGAPVTASEPVFGLMAEALGLDMRNERFQLSVMNDTEPSARDIAALEDDLRTGKVKAFIYNRQLADPLTERLLGIAEEAGVAVVGVTETLPAGKTFQQWMLEQIDELGRALGTPSS